MTRFFILIGYFSLMVYLQVSNTLNQYINVHYRYLIILSMIFSFILAGAQLIIWDHESQQQKTKPIHDRPVGKVKRKCQQILIYLILLLPLIVGFGFPTVSLDTSIVEAKGFNFPLSKESVGDPDVQTQYLKPDTSMYFNAKDYQNQMEETLSKFTDKEELIVTEEDYLEVMELIYTYPSAFIGKKISYTGFVYQTTAKERETLDSFVFRFGIIHCVADSGVFGLLTRFSPENNLENNEWVNVSGTIQTEYYQPFKRTLPIVQVTDVEKISKPKNQYVYHSF